MTKALLAAIVICLCAATLEGLMAGRGVKRRLAQLRQPPHSPTFSVWIVIGGFYYVICFVILVRLVDSPPSLRGRAAALVLVVLLLLGNALWNLTFFRLRNIDASAVVLTAYSGIGLLLMLFLRRVDPVSGWVFLPYLIYLAYATWWSLSLRRLNPKEPDELS